MSFYIQQYLNNLATANAHQMSPMSAAASRKAKRSLEEKRLQSRIKYRNRVANESDEQRQRRLERDRTRHQLRYRQKKVQEQMLEALKSNPNMSMAQAQNLLAQLPNTTVAARNSHNVGVACPNSHNHHQHQHHHQEGHFQQRPTGGATGPNPMDFLQLCSGNGNDSSTDSSRDDLDPFKAELRRSRNAAKYYRRLMNESEEQRKIRLEKDRIRHKLKYVQQKQEKVKLGLLAGNGNDNHAMGNGMGAGSSSGMAQSSHTSAFTSMTAGNHNNNGNNHNVGANHPHHNGHNSNVSTFTSMYSKLHPAFPSTHFPNSFVPAANHQMGAANSSISNRYNLRDYPYFQ